MRDRYIKAIDEAVAAVDLWSDVTDEALADAVCAVIRDTEGDIAQAVADARRKGEGAELWGGWPPYTTDRLVAAAVVELLTKEA